MCYGNKYWHLCQLTAAQLLLKTPMNYLFNQKIPQLIQHIYKYDVCMRETCMRAGTHSPSASALHVRAHENIHTEKLMRPAPKPQTAATAIYLTCVNKFGNVIFSCLGIVCLFS